MVLQWDSSSSSSEYPSVLLPDRADRSPRRNNCSLPCVEHWTTLPCTEHEHWTVSARCQIWNIKWCVQCAGKGDVQLCVFGIAQNMLHLTFALTLSSLLPNNCTQCANVCTLFFVTPSLQVHPLCSIILLAMHSYCALGIILQHSLFTSVVLSKSVWEYVLMFSAKL